MKDVYLLGVVLLTYLALRVGLALLVDFARKRLGVLWDTFVPLVSPLHALIVATSFQGGFRLFERDTRWTFLLLEVALAWAAIRALVILVCDGYFRWLKRVPVPTVLKRILAGALYLAALFAELHVVSGVAVGDLLVVAAVLALVAGIALQGFLGSFFTGLSISLQNKFSVGDLVRIGDVEGHVVEIDWRSTQIRTRQNDVVTAPNRLVSEALVTNYHRAGASRRATVRVPVVASASPNRVKALLVQSAVIAEGVLPSPEPVARLESYDRDSIEYSLAFWVASYEDGPAVEDRVRTLAWYRLRREALLPRAMMPTEAVSTEHPALSPYLSRVPIFAVVAPERLASLEKRASIELYGRGEPVFRQGDPGGALYVLKSGAVAIHVEGDETARATLGSGGFFGERSLLTGEPRAAHATATEDTELIVIRKEPMLELLQDTPEAAERISAVIVEQDRRNAAIALTPAEVEEMSSSFLDKVKAFFDL